MNRQNLQNRNKEKSTRFTILLKIVKEIVGFAASFTVIIGGFDIFYERYIAIPDLKHIVEESGEEYFKCDFELKDAQLYIHPQILLTKDNHIIRMINVEAFWEETSLNYNADITGFEFNGTGWNEAIVCCSRIKEQIKEPHDDLHIKQAYLLKMVYKKQKSGKEKEAFYIVEYGAIPRRVKEEEIVERGQDIDLSLEDLEINIKKIALDCELILKEM